MLTNLNFVFKGELIGPGYRIQNTRFSRRDVSKTKNTQYRNEMNNRT